MLVALAADCVTGPDRLVRFDAAKGLLDQPRPGQRMIEGGDLVVQQIGIGLVEIDALLDDGLVVGMQRDAGGVEDARPFEAARLDLERIVAAAPARVAPLADGVAEIEWEFRHIGGELAAIRIDVPVMIMIAVHKNVGDGRRDDDFEPRIADHDARHAGRNAVVGRIDALPALRHVGKVRIIDGLIFGCQRRLLAERGRILRRQAVVPTQAPGAACEQPAVAGAPPLAREVGIFRIIPGPRAGSRAGERHQKCDCTDRAAPAHDVLPSGDHL
jgi:hypothetical protein